MAQSRANIRRGVNIWPSFVDALSTLVLVVIFALMIFVIAQQVLSNELDNTERSRSALRARVIGLTDQLSALQDESNRRESRYNQLKAQLNENSTELETVRDELALSRIQNNELLESLGQNDRNQRALKDERSGNRALITSLKSQVANLNGVVNSQDSEIQTLNRRNVELLAMLDQSEESDRNRGRMISQLKTTRNNLENRIASNESLMLEIQARLATLLQSYGDLESNDTEVAVLLSQDRLRSDLTIGVNATSLLYDRITQLVISTQTRLETLLKARDEALARLAIAQEQADKNREKLAKTTTDLNSTINLLSTTESELNVARNIINNKHEKSRVAEIKLREELVKRDEMIQSTNAELTAYRTQLFDASSEIAKLLSEAEYTQLALSKAISEREDVSAELINAYERINASEAEITLLAADLDNFSRLRRILQEQIDDLRKERNNLQNMLQESQKSQQAAKRALQSTKTELDLLKKGASQLEATSSATQSALAEALAQLTKAEDARDLALVSAQEAKLLRKQEGIALVEAESRIEALQGQIAQLLARLGTATRQGQSDRRQLISQQGEIQVLETRLSSLEVSLALAEQVDELMDYRSEFYGSLSRALKNRNEIQMIGERFILPSEVLFDSGSTKLSTDGRQEIIRIGRILTEIVVEIPNSVDWILRIDGHTDRQPISANNPIGNNWRLSTERALAVSTLLVEQGFPPERLAVTGFGEHQPLVNSNTPTGYRQNRRIELQLTQR